MYDQHHLLKVPRHSTPRTKHTSKAYASSITKDQKSSGLSRSSSFCARNRPSAADLDSKARRIDGGVERLRLARRSRSRLRSISYWDSRWDSTVKVFFVFAFVFVFAVLDGADVDGSGSFGVDVLAGVACWAVPFADCCTDVDIPGDADSLFSAVSVIVLSPCEDSAVKGASGFGASGLDVERLLVSGAGLTIFDGPTAARRTLSAILVTTATRSSSSKTIEPTFPRDTDCAVTYEEGWLAGFTPVRLPLDAFLA